MDNIETIITFSNRVDREAFSIWLKHPDTTKYIQSYFKSAYSSGGALPPLDEWIAKMKRIAASLTVSIEEKPYPLETHNFNIKVEYTT